MPRAENIDGDDEYDAAADDDEEEEEEEEEKKEKKDWKALMIMKMLHYRRR